MTIGPGTTLGPYEILSLLGEGGMGSVWKARDPRLGRFVAIKVARAQFSERFDREARAVAALNHPNICTLYDVGPNYLVMEYIEGPTLTGRIKQGAVQLDAALPILRQLVDAIEAAHEKNITHRDLKPDNIKITPQGVVKVLDFGLAKAAESPTLSDDPANAPTLRLATVAGMIMGTPAYMSPEQASAQPADKRADIWAFGVIALEMFTATQLFEGKTVAHILAEVLSKEFDVYGAAMELQPLLKRCLVRDQNLRMRDMGEARIALMKIAAGEVDSVAAIPFPVRRKWLFPSLAALFALGMAGIGVHDWMARRPVAQPLVKLETNLGATVPMDVLRVSLAISPDGTRVVFVGNSKAGTTLFSRRLDQDLAAEIPGTAGAEHPFFSPDGRWVGFFGSGSLKKVSLDGGVPIALCEASGGRGASWGEGGNIVAALTLTGGLSIVSASGGTPVPLADLASGEFSLRFPSMLPGGRAVLFTSNTSVDALNAKVEVYSFPQKKRKVLMNGNFPRYLASGHLAYIQSNTVFAVPFDRDRLEVTGAPFPLLENVAFASLRAHALYDVSQTGTLVYYRSSSIDQGTEALSWLDSSGRATPVPGVIGVHRLRLSPDGKRVAYLLPQGGRVNLWIYDFQSAAKTKLTFEERPSDFAWTPDSRAIVFSARNKAYWTRADGASQPQQILEIKTIVFLSDISPDGKLMAFSTSTNTIHVVALEQKGASAGESAPRVGKMDKCCQEVYPVYGARFSPDGKWIAYHAAEAGGGQVYVRSVPDSGAKWQVSVGEGGAAPVWSPNGRELFYKQMSGRIMVLDYTTKGGAFAPGTPRPWTEHRVPGNIMIPDMSVAPDGKRMIVLGAQTGQDREATPQAAILFNLFDEVRRRAKTGGQ
ncbi:MAG: protein kinase [Candidatus Solibacter usitatus]|nr:protein kinase [Candidatus Solibacter usitatus]